MSANGDRKRRMRSWTRRVYGYGLLTLGPAAGGAALAGGGDRTKGIAAAWMVQLGAVWLLDRALAAGARATGPWLAGIALRAGGLAVTGGLAWAGMASRDLPAAYGVAMVGLLLTEAFWLWLAHGGGRSPRPDAAARTDEPKWERRAG